MTGTSPQLSSSSRRCGGISLPASNQILLLLRPPSPAAAGFNSRLMFCQSRCVNKNSSRPTSISAVQLEYKKIICRRKIICSRQKFSCHIIIKLPVRPFSLRVSICYGPIEAKSLLIESSSSAIVEDQNKRKTFALHSAQWDSTKNLVLLFLAKR